MLHVIGAFCEDHVMGVGTQGGGPPLRVVPETLAQVARSLEQTAAAFHDEIRQLSERGDALLGTWKGRAGPTFVEPFDDWKTSANDVVERLKAAAVLIADANTSFVESDQP